MIKKILINEEVIWCYIAQYINILLILYTALITFLSTIPGIDDGSLTNTIYLWVPPTLQSIGHVIAYGGLAILWFIYFDKSNHKSKQAMFLSFIITALFGIFNEIVQQYIPGRDAVISDAILNMLGACIGLWYFNWKIFQDICRLPTKE